MLFQRSKIKNPETKTENMYVIPLNIVSSHTVIFILTSLEKNYTRLFKPIDTFQPPCRYNWIKLHFCSNSNEIYN